MPTTSSQEGPKDPKEYIRALLLTMYYEQSEHLHSDFSEAYLKVMKVISDWLLSKVSLINVLVDSSAKWSVNGSSTFANTSIFISLQLMLPSVIWIGFSLTKSSHALSGR